MKSSELQRKFSQNYPNTHDPDNPDHRIRKVRKLFAEYTKRVKVLDVGCADGSVFKPFVQRHELHGVDVSPDYLQGAIDLGYQARIHDIESTPLPYPDGTFDVVYAGETIERLTDTDWFLAEINRVLKPGGHFIVTYPNVRTLTSLAMMLFADLPPMYSARYRGPHFRDYTQRTIRIALANHHFRPDAMRGTHFHLPGLASVLPGWASQVVLRAVKTAESRYSEDEATWRDIYSR